MITYRLAFIIDPDPVNDFEAASNYLAEDDMTQYLLEDNRFGSDIKSRIKSIKWLLFTDHNGVIELETNDYLTDIELTAIKEWCDGQNSDGLGEGFSQQPFAEYLVGDKEYSWCSITIPRNNTFSIIQDDLFDEGDF